MSTHSPLHSLAEALREKSGQLKNAHVVTGFDGFVDEMTSLVEERQSLTKFDRVPTISRFAGLVDAAAGRNSLREIVITRVDPGGCAINLGEGLASLGVPVSTFATVGEPMHSAFQTFAAQADLTSWGKEPGRTIAMEFEDGKLMFSAVSQLADFTPEHMAEKLADGKFINACRSASVIALTDWTLLPHMTACWELLQREVFSKLQRRPLIFLDLVDPSSRSLADIRAMLAVLSQFEQCGPVTLGLNANEAAVLAKASGLHGHGSDITALGIELRDHLKITELLIHTRRNAVSLRSEGAVSMDGWFCDHPIKSTGAGDRFNAGWTLGYLLDLQPQERLLTALATAGFYVRHGRSPSFTELNQHLHDWSAIPTNTNDSL